MTKKCKPTPSKDRAMNEGDTPQFKNYFKYFITVNNFASTIQMLALSGI